MRKGIKKRVAMMLVLVMVLGLSVNYTKASAEEGYDTDSTNNHGEGWGYDPDYYEPDGEYPEYTYPTYTPDTSYANEGYGDSEVYPTYTPDVEEYDDTEYSMDEEKDTRFRITEDGITYISSEENTQILEDIEVDDSILKTLPDKTITIPSNFVGLECRNNTQVVHKVIIPDTVKYISFLPFCADIIEF